MQMMSKRIIRENIHIIEILTSFVENGINKCLKYWPELNQNMVACENYEITTSTGILNTLIMLHYLAWPDNKFQKHCWGIIELLEITNRERQKHPPSSVLIHGNYHN
ncbi:hypothetical protein HZS_7050 [Henneguya salminicola]|nr:hypothetical protein HZS_7050 [Henneguya salminicola]